MAVIGKIRNNVGLLVLIIALAIIAFLLMDVFSGPGSMTGEAISAGTVNGQALDYNVYQNRLNSAISNQQRTNPSMSDQQRLQIEEQTWDAYVKETLATGEYDRLGLTVPAEEMRNLFVGSNPHPSLANEPTFKNQETGQFDPELVRQYENSLAEADPQQAGDNIRQWNTFKKFIVKDQQSRKYNNLIKKAIFVPSWMAQQTNTQKNRKSDIEYVLVPYTNVDDSQVNISDSDLSSYLNNNIADFKQEASSDIEFITFPIAASDADKAAVETQMNDRIQEFRTTADDSSFIRLYSDLPFNGNYLLESQIPLTNKAEVMSANINQVVGPFVDGEKYVSYKVLDRRTIADSVSTAHILRRVQAGTDDSAAKNYIDSLYNLAMTGADFEELAVNNSEDKSNSDNGGDLGWVKPNQMVKPFNDAVFAGRTGEIKKVKTQFGWHLLKINQSNPTNTAAKVAIFTKDILPSTQTSNGIYAQANEFSSRNRTLDAFRAAAQEKGMNIQTATNLTQNAFNIEGLGANNEIPSWAFGNEVNNVSKVFIMDDKYTIAAVTKKRNAGKPSVDDARFQLESKVRNIKKAEQIISQIGGSQDLNGIASANGQTVQNATGVSFDGFVSALGNEPKVQAAAASLPQGTVSKPIAGERGVYVVKVTGITDAPAGDVAGDQKSTANLLRSRVDRGAMEAIKNASEVEDIRYQYRSR